MLLGLQLHNVTRNPAIARIADRTGCEWPSRSSQVDDFHVISKPVCDFLLVINSKLGPIWHCLATIARNGFQGHSRSMISV